VWSGTYVYALYYREYIPGNPGNHHFTYVTRNSGANGTTFGTTVYTELYKLYTQMSVANNHLFLSASDTMLCDFSTTITTLSNFGNVFYDGTRYIVCGVHDSKTAMLYSLTPDFTESVIQYLSTTTSSFYNMIYISLLGLYFMPNSLSSQKLNVIADTDIGGSYKKLPLITQENLYTFIKAK
jgi:hypothetical protein